MFIHRKEELPVNLKPHKTTHDTQKKAVSETQN